MWDLSFLTRDQTPPSFIESIVLTTGPPGPWVPFKEVGFLRSKLQSYSHNPGIPSQTPCPCAQPSRTVILEAWSPWTSSFSATWDLIRNVDSQVPWQKCAEMVCITLGERKGPIPSLIPHLETVKLGVWNQRWWEYLHHGNWQALQISAYYPFREQLPAHHWAPSRPTESETLEVGPSSLGLNKLSRWLWYISKFKKPSVGEIKKKPSVGNMSLEIGIEKEDVWTSLEVQWLRLCTPKGGGLGMIPGLGTRSHMLQLKSLKAAMKIKDLIKCCN